MVKIRKITKDDRDIFLSMSHDFYNGPAVLSPIPEDYHEKTFDELMRSEDYLKCYIFQYDGKTAGYGLLNICYSHEAGGKVVWIEELYVLPEFQGKGIATQFFSLLEFTDTAARYRLEAEPENSRAVKLYKKLGFENLPYMQLIKDMKK